jgi:hypothetical protein
MIRSSVSALTCRWFRFRFLERAGFNTLKQRIGLLSGCNLAGGSTWRGNDRTFAGWRTDVFGKRYQRHAALELLLTQGMRGGYALFFG